MSFQDYCQKVSNETGHSIEFVLFVYNSIKEHQIRNMQELDVFTQLTTQIPEIVNDHGANNFAKSKEHSDIHVRVLQDCIKLVTRKFSYLAINEIKEAYSLWSSGRIKGLEMFRGEFNQKQFGSILTSYTQYRAPVVEKLNDYIDAMKIAEEETQKASNFEKEFPSIVIEYMKRIEKWNDVPDFWCHAFRRRGWLTITKEEGDDMYQKALKEADLELQRRKIANGETTLQQALKGTGVTQQKKEDVAKSIARRMIVFEKCIQNKSWRPERQIIS